MLLPFHPEKAIYAFIREKGTHKVLVILNLSDKEQNISIKDKTLLGNPYNVFIGEKESLTDKPWKIEAWGYVIYDYRP